MTNSLVIMIPLQPGSGAVLARLLELPAPDETTAVIRHALRRGLVARPQLAALSLSLPDLKEMGEAMRVVLARPDEVFGESLAEVHAALTEVTQALLFMLYPRLATEIIEELPQIAAGVRTVPVVDAYSSEALARLEPLELEVDHGN